MRIQSVSLVDFRNYERFTLSNIEDLTVFVGPNAIGKTNILEAIQLLTSAASFRHPQIAQLIRQGCERARISMEAGDGNRELLTVLNLEAGKRRYSVNGKSKGAIDVRGILPAILFSPDDLQLAKKTSSIKRTALDDLGVQLTRNYYIVRRDYEKTLRYKNRLLKEEASTDLLESINETLITCGSQLYCYRRALFNRLLPHVSRKYDQISQGSEQFFSTYRPSWERIENQNITEDFTEYCNSEPQNESFAFSHSLESREAVRDQMARSINDHFDEERIRHRSLIGPHNDEILFFLSSKDVSAFASQGQQRSIVLAWKLAEVEMTKEVVGVSPVLLLDDVLSELDESRRDMLVNFVTDEVQTFITATDLGGFPEHIRQHARIVRLSHDVDATYYK